MIKYRCVPHLFFNFLLFGILFTNSQVFCKNYQSATTTNRHQKKYSSLPPFKKKISPKTNSKQALTKAPVCSSTTNQQKNHTSAQLTAAEREEGLKVSLIILTVALCMQDKTIAPRMVIRDLLGYLFHEVGHAMVAKILWKNPISIGIGACKRKEGKSIFKSKFFTLESWYPAGGYSYATKPQKLDPKTGMMVLDKTKWTLYLLAGGVCQTFAHLLCNTVEAYYAQDPINNPLTLKNICYDYGIAEALLENVIIPNDPEDGYKNDIRSVLEDCCNLKAPAILASLHAYAVLLLIGYNIIQKNGENLRKEKEFFVRKVLQYLCINKSPQLTKKP